MYFTFFVRASLLVALVAAACGGNGPEQQDPAGPDAAVPGVDGGASSPDSPRFLSFGTNVTSITEGESVTFTAVLTDPDGIDDLIGGSLTSIDGTVHYGAFATSGQEGSYTLSLSWAQMQQVADIMFRTMGSRVFRAEFFDVAGHSVERTVTVGLTCGGSHACKGRCGAACIVFTVQRISGTAACTSYGMTCLGSDPRRRAHYGTVSNNISTLVESCATVPAATLQSLAFLELEVRCIPSD